MVHTSAVNGVTEDMRGFDTATQGAERLESVFKKLGESWRGDADAEDHR